MRQTSRPEEKGGISKVKLALGAASLFLFIVGLKRTFRADDTPDGLRLEDAPREPEREPAERGRGRRRQG